MQVRSSDDGHARRGGESGEGALGGRAKKTKIRIYHIHEFLTNSLSDPVPVVVDDVHPVIACIPSPVIVPSLD